MKKILVLLLLIFSPFISTLSFAENCTYNVDSSTWWSISDALNNCLEWSNLVSGKDVKVSGAFWLQIKSWVNNISIYLWVFAVWSIVFGGLMMTLSVWEEEKIKKAKDIVKWWMIWFIWLISASAIITLVVKIMYSI